MSSEYIGSEYIGIETARKTLGDLVTAVQQGTDVVLTRNGKPAARIIAFKEPAVSTTTTEYGTWNFITKDESDTVEDMATEALGDYVGDYDVDAIVTEYRQAINEALPAGVSLNGDLFYGPAYDPDKDFDGYPVNDDGSLDIKAIVDSIDFWAIAERHDIAP
jgi:prevent-host-death family protein